MALDPKVEATIALHRFGLGPRAGSIAAIASDPRGALIADLDRTGAGRIAAGGGLLTSGEAARAVFAFREAQRAAARSARESVPPPRSNVTGANPGMPSPDGAPPNPPPRNAAPRDSTTGTASTSNAPAATNAAPSDGLPQPAARVQTPGLPQQIYLDEAKARLGNALDAEIGFAERLAWFWSNHFCVSADKGQVRPLAGAYEREAIRGNLTARFVDMLIAVETHPAMLFYLDNAGSIGPNSPAGRNRGRGLNENLAREILELHTLGVRTVYSQDDVTRFANVITGWTVVRPQQDSVHAGEFMFNERMHQPGPQTIIGKSYPDTGFEQGRAVLATLARHPATAKHMAIKLARHFVADDPPLALIERLTKRFRDTDGNLKELAKALLTAPEAWDAPRGKLKRPGEWVVSALRASGVREPDIRPLMQAQNLLGEPLWRPGAPNGFADDDATWLDGLAQRLDVANQLARRLGDKVDPKAVFEETIAPLASADTRQTIARAESRQQALALLFMTPEFQRR